MSQVLKLARSSMDFAKENGNIKKSFAHHMANPTASPQHQEEADLALVSGSKVPQQEKKRTPLKRLTNFLFTGPELYPIIY